jgi:hypothetical protein
MKRQFPYFWSIIDLHTVNLDSPITQLSCAMNILYRGDNLSPRMPCQWYVRGGGEGKRRILIGQSVPPPTPFGMAFGRLKLSPQYIFFTIKDT